MFLSQKKKQKHTPHTHLKATKLIIIDEKGHYLLTRGRQPHTSEILYSINIKNCQEHTLHRRFLAA